MPRPPFASFAAGLVLASIVAAQDASSIERDLAYGDAPAHRLDLSIPAGQGFPTLIFVHGGSLTSGDKADSDSALRINNMQNARDLAVCAVSKTCVSFAR